MTGSSPATSSRRASISAAGLRGLRAVCWRRRRVRDAGPQARSARAFVLPVQEVRGRSRAGVAPHRPWWAAEDRSSPRARLHRGWRAPPRTGRCGSLRSPGSLAASRPSAGSGRIARLRCDSFLLEVASGRSQRFGRSSVFRTELSAVVGELSVECWVALAQNWSRSPGGRDVDGRLVRLVCAVHQPVRA